jgi:hypothetical protein
MDTGLPYGYKHIRRMSADPPHGSSAGVNDCKCSWDQRLNVFSETRKGRNIFLVTHLMTYICALIFSFVQ